jgi:hypothetical protein
LVTCKKCGKEFKSEAALEDHLRDARVHRENQYRHRRPYSKWVLALFILLVICGIAILAYKESTVVQTTQTQTIPATSLSGVSKVILNDRLVNISGEVGALSFVNGTLNPIGKLDYKAYGQVQIISGCSTEATGVVCPTIQMIVLNGTGFAKIAEAIMGGGAGQVGTYAQTQITGSGVYHFTLNHLDYDGKYYFVFFFPNPSSPTQTAVVSITLVETWQPQAGTGL